MWQSHVQPSSADPQCIRWCYELHRFERKKERKKPMRRNSSFKFLSGPTAISTQKSDLGPWLPRCEFESWAQLMSRDIKHPKCQGPALSWNSQTYPSISPMVKDAVWKKCERPCACIQTPWSVSYSAILQDNVYNYVGWNSLCLCLYENRTHAVLHVVPNTCSALLQKSPSTIGLSFNNRTLFHWRSSLDLPFGFPINNIISLFQQ